MPLSAPGKTKSISRTLHAGAHPLDFPPAEVPWLFMGAAHPFLRPSLHPSQASIKFTSAMHQSQEWLMEKGENSKNKNEKRGGQKIQDIYIYLYANIR